MRVVAELCGVTQLDKMVYVICNESCIIRTLTVDTLSALGDIHVKEMRNPIDLVVCRHDRHLYVADWNCCIWRVSADDHSYVKWLPTDSTCHVYSLSVTSRRLLVTLWDPPSLREYSLTDRQLLRVVQLPKFVKWLWHGVVTTRGTFVVGHRGTSQDTEKEAVSK